jgi:ATP-binding cassette subfamily B protein
MPAESPPRHGRVRVLRRILPFYTPYRGQVAVGLACVLVSSVAAGAIPHLVERGIDALRAGAPPRVLWHIGGVMAAIAVATGALRYLMRELMNGLSRRIETDLRDALFARLLALDAAWYATTRTGDLMARLTNDVGAVRMATGPALMYLANTVFGGAVALVLMVRISPPLTALSLIPMLAMPPLMIVLGRRIHDRFEAAQAHFADLTTLLQEHVAGVRVVRAYRQEDAEAARFAALSDGYVTKNLHLARLAAVMNPAFTALAGGGAAIALAVGGQLVLDGAITVGALVAFLLYLAQLTWPLIALGWVTNLFQRGAASLARLVPVLDATPAIADPAAPVALPPRRGAGRRVSFHGVGFAFEAPDGTAARPVLRDVTIDVAPGTMLGVVGATGSGKSTLLELVPRLRDPTAGEVRLDGVPLHALRLADLRAEVGYVPQEALLFSETIGDNIGYGTDDAAAVPWAAAVAQLSETIAAAPDGLATLLGERGINLSGGQKQRATIARALARRPAVVLLDDALSAVDTETEARLLAALRDALAGRTAIVASHRVSALRAAHRIVVLDAGRVVEEGTHDTLVAKRGAYWHLVERQALEEELEAAARSVPG